MKSHLNKMYKNLIQATCSIALLLSCGKRIENSKEQVEVVERPSIVASFVELKIDAKELNTSKTYYQVKKDGWAKIPSAPKVINSLSKLIYTKLTFENSYNSNSDSTGLVCHYISIKSEDNTYQHKFTGCKEDIDADGEYNELNYLPGDELAVLENEKIFLETHSSNQSDQLIIKSRIEIDWL